jgi:uracil-DNA glycosylase
MDIYSKINKIKNSDLTYCINALYKYKIDKSWFSLFIKHHKKLVKILKFVDNERKTKIIYPIEENIFKVFTMNIKDIKVIFLGQDPYIKKNQATGLSFSVPIDCTIPPSLYNIYRELKLEFPEKNYSFLHGDLTKWFNQGIFLLNSSLTVIENKSNSHQYLWNDFTNIIIEYIDSNRNNIIFLLLGNFAINKKKYILNNKIITGVHPSPLSAHNGFFNSNIFKNIENIDWSI